MTDATNQSRKKILIVEDDEVNRKIMELQLRKYYHIDLAKNGNEALNLFLENDYSLILMDINLGVGKNGIAVMKEIRSSEKGRMVPVIAITAFASFGQKEAFLASGFNNYISKPYQTDELLRIIMDTINFYN